MKKIPILLFLSGFWLVILNTKDLMSVAWHPKRWWDWCVSEDEKKEIDPMFIKELKKFVFK